MIFMSLSVPLSFGLVGQGRKLLNAVGLESCRLSIEAIGKGE